jgi:hypothetical protein
MKLKKRLMKKNLKKQSTSKMRRVHQKLRVGSCERDNPIDNKIWKKTKSNSKRIKFEGQNKKE